MIRFILLTAYFFLILVTANPVDSPYPKITNRLSILAVLPTAYGHTYPAVELLRELSTRGHEITLLLLSCNDLNIEIPPSVKVVYHQVDPVDCAYFKTNFNQNDGLFSMIPLLFKIIGMWNSPEILQFISSYMNSNKVDVVLCDIFTISVASIARNLSIPSVEVAHHLDIYTAFASYIPMTMSMSGRGISLPLTYTQRLENVVHFLITPLFSMVIQYELTSSISMLNIEFVRYCDLVIVTSEFGLLVPRDIPPFVKVVGALFSVKRQTPEPELTRILDEAQVQGKKVVYVSMGTVIHVDQNQLSRLVEGFRGLNNTVVLWAISKENQHNLLPDNIPDHLIIKQHVPQIYVLTHPAVKLFVSHCGANSAIEAVWSGVPVLAIPGMGDQIALSSQMASRGTARIMDISNLESAELTEMVIHMLNSENYTRNAKKMSDLVQSSGGLTEARYHVERLGMLGVTDFFVPERLKVSWFVSYQLDIYLTILVAAVLFWKFCCYCCRCCCCRVLKKDIVKLKIQ